MRAALALMQLIVKRSYLACVDWCASYGIVTGLTLEK
jgi:hypothetical protein